MGEARAMPKALSVVGAGRSGTTVLASLLNEVEGVTSAGELRWLWERGVRDGRPCGCGRPPEQCPVWGPVVTTSRAQLAARTPPRTIDDLIAAQHALKRPVAFPRVLRTLGRDDPGTGPAPLALVRDAMADACRTLADATTDAGVVVDISKRPLDAAVLAGVPDLDSYVLHVVRDPRAVVHSWRRAKTFSGGRRGAHDGHPRPGVLGAPLDRQRAVRRGAPSPVSAGPLAPHPLRGLRRSPARHDRGGARLRRRTGDDARSPTRARHRLHPNHIVAGNPSRFTTGEVTIRSDDAWTREMPTRDQRVVVALTLPLLGRYGYVGRGRLSRSDLRRAPLRAGAAAYNDWQAAPERVRPSSGGSA